MVDLPAGLWVQGGNRQTVLRGLSCAPAQHSSHLAQGGSKATPVMTRTSFYIDCSPGSLGIPQYDAGVPSWAPPAKCPLDQTPSLVDGGAAKNCRPHQEECRRIHKALESKNLQPSVMFCPLGDLVFLHYNDAGI